MYFSAGTGSSLSEHHPSWVQGQPLVHVSTASVRVHGCWWSACSFALLLPAVRGTGTFL